MLDIKALEATYAEYQKLAGAEISFELSTHIVGLVEKLPDDACIIDLGTGWSSYLLRRIRPNATVVSVDDHEGWMQKSMQFCASNGVEPKGFMLLSGAKESLVPACADLVIHDMGNRSTRERELKWALSLLKPGGSILLDDMHKNDLRTATEQRLNKSNLHWESVKATTDALGRYAYLVTKPLETPVFT